MPVNAREPCSIDVPLMDCCRASGSVDIGFESSQSDRSIRFWLLTSQRELEGERAFWTGGKWCCCVLELRMHVLDAAARRTTGHQ
jgi:hypothetical protein